ncbi:MAG: diaminopimelate decarboxylase [Spirochaetes bacterium]|nr:diaminopimelate decarboxylase [Spirochaetota bacterium]
MTTKKIPFSGKQLGEIISRYPTPFHIYDEKAIVDNAVRLKKAFSWAHGFREYFAVKALPNPHIMKIFSDMGFGADCSSMAELILAEKVGISGESVFFSSNDTPADEYVKAAGMGAIINLDDITHVGFLEENAGLPDLISFRYNPGPLRDGNAIIGKPEEAKYGLTREQLCRAYETVRGRGVKRFGLHTMVASNELDPEYFVDTAEMLFNLLLDINSDLGIKFEFINLGGGFGIPYRPEQKPLDIEYISEKIKALYDEKISGNGLHPVRIYMESGRMMTGPYGYLATRVIHKKETYKNYIGLDSSMANLMRPGIYGAYHHITVLGKEDWPCDHVYDVTGSLCENNDKFAIDRPLPEIEIGDILVIHDTGAHGHAMGFNYNGKLRSAELLLRPDGSVKLIRRAETIEDYFATLDFGGL